MHDFKNNNATYLKIKDILHSAGLSKSFIRSSLDGRGRVLPCQQGQIHITFCAQEYNITNSTFNIAFCIMQSAVFTEHARLLYTRR